MSGGGGGGGFYPVTLLVICHLDAGNLDSLNSTA